MSPMVGPDLLRAWVRTGVAALGEARAEIDALNVFPVPDGDTGTNLYLTMEAAAQQLQLADESLPDDLDAQERTRELAAALVRGAMLGARGNSGVILSQILRGMVSVDAATPGAALAAGLARATTLAYASVGEPKEGTILTVLRRAADAAQACPDHDDLPAVIRAAAAAAEQALAETTEQLPALRAAGVVDSGGRGLVVVLAALEEVITGERRVPPPVRLPQTLPAAGTDTGYAGPGFEVMYLLHADDGDIPGLKRRLLELGDSLVMVGGDGLWNVHVHVDDAGAAIEAGLGIGRPHRIAVTWLLGDTGRRGDRGRGVVAVAHGPGMVALLEQLGVGPVAAQPRLAPATGELLAAIHAQGTGEVIVLPSDKDVRAAAEAAAVAAREQGLRVAVVPTRSITQSLAAIAVADPHLPFDDDVVAMSRAGAAGYGAITVSSRVAVTTAGRCAPGDVLGVVDGDILIIGSDRLTVARQTLDRMLSAGGELVTVVRGTEADDALVDAVLDAVRATHPGIETVVYDGGQPVWPLIFGVE